MQFEVHSENEYIKTIEAIVNANIYHEISLMYALKIEDNIIGKIPSKYPCIVSIEVEDLESDNRLYCFSACKFIYINELLTGLEYQDDLDKLSDIDLRLSQLYDSRKATGSLNDSGEITKLELESTTLEKKLF